MSTNEHGKMDSRVRQAMLLIEGKIDENVDFTKLATDVGLSTSRFHHLFAEKTGETPGQYLRRIRLDEAALRLRWTDQSVRQIACDTGYASQPSFTQAFQRQYGMVPLAFRRDRETFPPEPYENAENKRVVVVEHEELFCLARRYLGPPCNVPQHWDHFLKSLPADLARRAQGLFVGILYDDIRFTAPEKVRYDCCIPIRASEEYVLTSKLPDFHRVVTRAGLYASLPYHGYYAASQDVEGMSSIASAYSYLLDSWLSSSRYNFAGEYALEVYAVPHGRCEPSELHCTILVPVD